MKAKSRLFLALVFDIIKFKIEAIKKTSILVIAKIEKAFGANIEKLIK